MAEFQRRQKKNNVSVDIKDADGSIVRTITFNPHDVRGRKEFAEIIKKSAAINSIVEEANFDADKVILMVDTLDDVFSHIDKIFGAGITDLITQGVIDEESTADLGAFLDIIKPYYMAADKAEQKLVAPYLAKEDE